MHSIQKTTFKPNLWIRKKRDGQFVKLSFHNSPILSLYRYIMQMPQAFELAKTQDFPWSLRLVLTF